MTKESLTNIPYRKLSLNCKQHFKVRKEHVFIKCLFDGVRTIAVDENCPRLGLGFDLGLGLELGFGAIFLGGNCPRTLFNKVLPYLLYCKDMVKPYYIKGVRRVKKTSVRR